ncbi:MAG: type II toxin-antitoxin system RelE/ParE family toxin [Candidatus Marinimicrobia bacterium]|nr:type II toxin-antitoxin system RelE/ParE family toxin [Candidatus Neomarinimicrobiota bacterium]
MAKYELLIKPSAVKEIDGIGDKTNRRRVVQRILALAEDPRPKGCDKLTRQERYRVRQGPYRIIYAVDDTQQTILIVKVGHRKEVYR